MRTQSHTEWNEEWEREQMGLGFTAPHWNTPREPSLSRATWANLPQKCVPPCTPCDFVGCWDDICFQGRQDHECLPGDRSGLWLPLFQCKCNKEFVIFAQCNASVLFWQGFCIETLRGTEEKRLCRHHLTRWHLMTRPGILLVGWF